MQTHKTIYKKTNTGATQIWYCETDLNFYRTISGQIDGKKVISAWTEVIGKNKDKKNKTSNEEQCLKEVAALYKKKLEKDYHVTLDKIGTEVIFKPMLAEKYQDYVDKIDFTKRFFTQFKYDGLRCVVNKTGMWTRNGKPIVNCPHIFAELKSIIGDTDLTFDGELYNHDFNADFNSLVSMVKKTKPTPETWEEARKFIQYHIYDMCDSNDLTFGDRCLAIPTLINKTNKDIIKIVPTTIHYPYIAKEVAEYSKALIKLEHEDALEEGYEGLMVRMDTRYEHKRTKNLLKVKNFMDKEFELIDIVEGKGNWSSYAKSALFNLEDGRTFSAGVKGTREYCKDLLNNKNQYIGTMCTVKYFSLTPDGIPRFGILKEINRSDI